jgi:Flp pilus assembly pilin Flp
MRTKAANVPDFRVLLKRFAVDTGAATAIEYAMIAAGVGATIAGTVYSLGTTIQETLYNKIGNAIQ